MHLHTLLEFGKEGFDLIAGSSRTFIGWRSGQRARRLPSGFLPVHEQPAIGPGGAAFFLRTTLALGRRRAIRVALAIPTLVAIAQWLSFRTVLNVLRRLIAELIASEVSARLMTTVNDRNVRLDTPGQQPRQELSTTVGLVRSQTLRPETALLDSFDHAAC